MSSILQQGHCAFARSCVHVHEDHVRIKGTNLTICGTHAREMQVASSDGFAETQFSSTTFHPPRSGARRRRGSWHSGVGGM